MVRKQRLRICTRIKAILVRVSLIEALPQNKLLKYSSLKEEYHV